MAEDQTVYVPGDFVTVDLGRVTHYQNVAEIVALYETEDGKRFELRGEPGDTLRDVERNYPAFTSKAKVSATVPADVVPGEYAFQSARVVTHAGQELKIEGEKATGSLYLVEEPGQPPTF